MVLLVLVCVGNALFRADPSGDLRSRYVVRGEEESADLQRSEIVVEVYGGEVSGQPARPLPVRVIVTSSDGTHPDGSGHGTYGDGRFFADGHFAVAVAPGTTRVQLRSGPNRVPLDFEMETTAGKRYRVRACLPEWFSPEARGWYGGDNHVHAQHDSTAVVKTGLGYTALQARANGLSFITESGSHVDYEGMDALSTPTFVFRCARELHAGCYAGHLNTPGIAAPIAEDALESSLRQPLPVQAVKKLVHGLGGVVIHTHPLAPAHQLHWMGATELFSDAALGQCADLLDIDSRATELLWFAALNLGNRVACSSYTDAALGRLHTASPGDRRVYCRADEFSDGAFVAALRQGRTFATNGGPIFAFFTIDGRAPGDAVIAEPGRRYESRVEVHCLYPLRSAQLVRNGRVLKEFDVGGRKGAVVLSHALEEDGKCWYVFRAEDEHGHWAITSPIYFEVSSPAPAAPAQALLLEIANCTRMVQLRPDFFAHIIVTVGPEDALAGVSLFRDGEVVRDFRPEMGTDTTSGKIPVTERFGEYRPGWLWHPGPGRSVHFQADWPISEGGWYCIHATTVNGHEARSDAVHFDADTPNSHEISVAHLNGRDTRFTLWGYGEEMALAEVRPPYEGDHWWYPKNTYWRIRAIFEGEEHVLQGGDERSAGRFRR